MISMREMEHQAQANDLASFPNMLDYGERRAHREQQAREDRLAAQEILDECYSGAEGEL